jgi:hypothetical protein
VHRGKRALTDQTFRRPDVIDGFRRKRGTRGFGAVSDLVEFVLGMRLPIKVGRVNASMVSISTLMSGDHSSGAGKTTLGDAHGSGRDDGSKSMSQGKRGIALLVFGKRPNDARLLIGDKGGMEECRDLLLGGPHGWGSYAVASMLSVMGDAPSKTSGWLCASGYRAFFDHAANVTATGATVNG